ncbi:stress responsive alpha/beta barrel protein [Marinoscillum furvescens DSM 4134]|uniref:Stress responsive alpha/beta barrel protein n=2 Tax=Marinoscillum furvescens TaxID=1026 RepID=A0A3D9L328_MARFU|nr:stress responsive alpha/beta barrel protein [Marinoscillum furvescens DSM 4134]
MQKRNFLKRSLAAVGAASLLPWNVSAAPKKGKSIIDGQFVHMVFFWLKPETNVNDFIASTEGFLKKVKEVRKYHLGTPAGTPREVVDNSYTVSLVVTFESKADQDRYQEHEAHVAYVEANKDKWDTVKIFDSWGAL